MKSNYTGEKCTKQRTQTTGCIYDSVFAKGWAQCSGKVTGSEFSVITIFMALPCTSWNEKQACSFIISLTGEHSMKNKKCVLSDQQGNDASLPSADNLHASHLLWHHLPPTTAGPRLFIVRISLTRALFFMSCGPPAPSCIPASVPSSVSSLCSTQHEIRATSFRKRTWGD